MPTHHRLLQPDDAPALAALLSSNREFLAPWEPVRDESYFTIAGQEKVVADHLAHQRAGNMYCAIILDDHDQPVGRINLSIYRGPFQSATMGYWLAEHVGGRGLATAAVGEVVEVAFTTLGLHRVEAGTIPENLRSQAVLTKNGFTRFGYAPAYLHIAGRYRDHVLFQKLAPGITPSD